MRTKTWMIALSALVLTGCSGTNYVDGVPVAGAGTGMRQAEIQLAQSATSIKQSLLELSEIKRAVHPTAKLPKPPNAARLNMNHLASIDWTGPIEPLVRNVAKLTGYRLHVLGKAPSIPIIVSLSEKNVPIATILRNAAFQCGNRVDIVVYPKSSIIELRYSRL